MKLYKINETLQHSYYQMPQELFCNEKYKRLSIEAKVIYSFLLNRMNPSRMNKWINDKGEIYLIYTRKEIQSKLNLSDKPVTRAFKELREAKLIKEEKQGFISKLVESVIITKDSNNELHMKKINFRRSFIDMLTKLFGNGILDVLVPVEINGKEEFILGTGNITDSQVQEYLDRLNEYYETKFYQIYEKVDEETGNIIGEFIPKKDEKIIRMLPISSNKSTTKSPIIKDDTKYGIVTYNPNKPKEKVLEGVNDYATS